MVLLFLSTVDAVRCPHIDCGLRSCFAFFTKFCEVLRWRRVSYWTRRFPHVRGLLSSSFNTSLWKGIRTISLMTLPPKSVAFSHLWICSLELCWHKSLAPHSTFLFRWWFFLSQLQCMKGSLQILEGCWYLGKCDSGSRFCSPFGAHYKDRMRAYLSLFLVAAGTDVTGGIMVFSAAKWKVLNLCTFLKLQRLFLLWESPYIHLITLRKALNTLSGH